MVQLFVSIMVSDGGLMNTFLFIVWPCKNADFVPKEYTFKFKEKLLIKLIRNSPCSMLENLF